MIMLQTMITRKYSVVGIAAILLIAAWIIHMKIRGGTALDVISCSAEKLWNCPANEIRVKSTNSHQYEITGCENRAEIFCKGPADGCTYMSEKKSFPTFECREQIWGSGA